MEKHSSSGNGNGNGHGTTEPLFDSLVLHNGVPINDPVAIIGHSDGTRDLYIPWGQGCALRLRKAIDMLHERGLSIFDRPWCYGTMGIYYQIRENGNGTEHARTVA